MTPIHTSLGDNARLTLDNITDRAADLVQPTLRLGVTGLSRAGKTVFIASLVHNLLHRGRLPMFEAMRSGRLSTVRLEDQPDDQIPRFDYETHIDRLVDDRIWPDSTRAISELRLTLEYESASRWNRLFSRGRISIDIVDYPGEWLLDLPLLGQDFASFSKETEEQAMAGTRAKLSNDWLTFARSLDYDAPADEKTMKALHERFAAYLTACRADEHSLSTLPPGRFLMPGDLEGSPALTFAPLPGLGSDKPKRGSLAAQMERRYEAYKSVVVRPFFRNHFARLDRQIVLVDTLQALSRGPEAVADLERALTEVLACFRPGRNSFLSSLVRRRIDKVLIAATKADHLHHESHDRLEKLTRRLVDNAAKTIGASGAGIEVMAIASVRATREATVESGEATLPVIVGTPISGEKIGSEIFDGKRKTAIFPGDLPANPEAFFRLLRKGGAAPKELADVNAVRFRPPEINIDAEDGISLPHIRLDRALQFLLGDRLA
ncbi:YcjX family protein [Martelella endophytica]|uniref:Amino acid regulated cytosolic protein n=1 Tax=Martelella endophytica TaxID=1486262 RepID=A0A0D5LTL0_MAREN|nr:YcjX family protein [Martelella endophytica]AJY46713.1 amino acid regulated cytosolic protein [Martelella endophytica]